MIDIILIFLLCLAAATHLTVTIIQMRLRDRLEEELDDLKFQAMVLKAMTMSPPKQSDKEVE